MHFSHFKNMDKSKTKKYAICELKIDAEISKKTAVTKLTTTIIKTKCKLFNNYLLRRKLQFDKKLCMLYNCKREKPVDF